MPHQPRTKQLIKARLKAPPKPGVVGMKIKKPSSAANEILTKGYKTLK